ncbi:hypothetical protein CYMTET_30473 [Cymbomonas tetramitiformis]|uniref:Uncharacterized protein n=1 Tax=Cymbomonas tetramitiformis TaxID=36881 RepID=A0AAE0FIS5_9CHLO|nr:hypothetical protein CYMTET_30473 [Cymbomonas tetramitiformis]
MALCARKQADTPLEGKWVADSPTSLYLEWKGTGYPCVVCFRVWGLTDAHPDTRGACPFACIESFANDKHLTTSKPAPPRPPLTAPPAAALPATPLAPASFQSVRLSLPAPGGVGDIPAVDHGALAVPAPEDVGPPIPDEPVGSAHIFHDDDTDWPAFRSSPVWLPNSAVTGNP